MVITQGVGFADTEVHAAEIAYCRRNGYTVTELEDVEPVTEPADNVEEPAEVPMPRRSGSAEAWRAYAVAHGVSAEEANELSRDQLVERFTSEESES
ncbi:hypothetical protein GCM10010199_62130 [Dactylosporangium roseum]